MWQVLAVNLAWVCVLGLWCILYFVQAKIDRAKILSNRRQ